MAVSVPNFLGEYPNLLSKEVCEKGIELFESASKFGLTQDRKQHAESKTIADDEMLFNCYLNADHLGLPFYDDLMASIWTGYDLFQEEYPIALEKTDPHHIHAIKMQKTKPAQGFHAWHYETSSRNNANRILTFTVYLNDVEEGGETEFLYYSKRVKAEQGKVVIFPAGFTHLHRGNPPLSNNKYIATGWFEF